MNKNKVLITVVAVVLVLALAAAAYYFLMPNGQDGAKKVTVELVVGEEKIIKEVNTDAQFLAEILRDMPEVEGEDGTYGFFITGVNGYTADSNKQEWYCITKGGASLETGAEITPIADGDTFEITLTIGW